MLSSVQWSLEEIVSGFAYGTTINACLVELTVSNIIS